jgi:hypothetical protein
MSQVVIWHWEDLNPMIINSKPTNVNLDSLSNFYVLQTENPLTEKQVSNIIFWTQIHSNFNISILGDFSDRTNGHLIFETVDLGSRVPDEPKFEPVRFSEVMMWVCTVFVIVAIAFLPIRRRSR